MKFRHIMGAERYLESPTGSGLTKSDERQFQTKTRATIRAKNSAAAKQSEIRCARRHRIHRRLQIRRASQPARETRTRCFCRHDAGCDRIHYAADFANAFQESGDDEFL